MDRTERERERERERAEVLDKRGGWLNTQSAVGYMGGLGGGIRLIQQIVREVLHPRISPMWADQLPLVQLLSPP